MRSRGVLPASSSFFWSCMQQRGKYEGSSGCMGLFRLSLTQSPVLLGCGISLSLQSHMWVERVAPQRNVPPRPWRLAKECPSPLLSFTAQPLLSDFDTFEIIFKFIWFFNGNYMCAKVVCFSAKVLSTLYFSHLFFFTVQEFNNGLCFPVV